MKHAPLALASLTLALAPTPTLNATPAPDVLMEGTRAVKHEIVIEDSPLFAQFDWYVANSTGLGAAPARVHAGEPFSFSSKYESKLYALEPGVPCPARIADLNATARAIADFPVRELHSVSLGSPVESLTTRLRFERGEDAVARLVVVDDEYVLDRATVAIVAAGLAVGVVGLAVLARRTARTKAAA